MWISVSLAGPSDGRGSSLDDGAAAPYASLAKPPKNLQKESEARDDSRRRALLSVRTISTGRVGAHAASRRQRCPVDAEGVRGAACTRRKRRAPGDQGPVVDRGLGRRVRGGRQPQSRRVDSQEGAWRNLAATDLHRDGPDARLSLRGAGQPRG